MKNKIKNIFKRKKDTKISPLLSDILSNDQNRVKEFLDIITPSVIKSTDTYMIIGNTYRSVWAIREYPTSTKESAILKALGEKQKVSLKVYLSQLSIIEQNKILENASNKNRMNLTDNNMQSQLEAGSNIATLTDTIEKIHNEKERLVFTSVFIEMIGNSHDDLLELQAEVTAELSRLKKNIDRLYANQKNGFLAVNPVGFNPFKSQFERVLPSSSVANLYPFSYSGITDTKGFKIGRDVGGTNIIIDFNKKTEDKPNSNILILGNSGQGKVRPDRTLLKVA